MGIKTLPIDLDQFENTGPLKHRLIEVALFDWIRRSLDVNIYRTVAITHLLLAYGLNEVYVEEVVYSLTAIEQFKPNQFEYALLYNQLGNVPQKDAKQFMRTNTISIDHPIFKGMGYKQPLLRFEILNDIKDTLLRVTKLRYDYQQLPKIQQLELAQ